MTKKKNLSKSVILLVLILIWLPLGLDDMLLLPLLINLLGIQIYTIISIVLVIWLYNSIEGKTIKDKINNIKKELGEGY